MSADTLEDILVSGRRRLKESMGRVSLSEMERRAKGTPAPQDFVQAVVRPGFITLIAEMKKKSPSAGVICESYDPGMIALAYARGGAAALSVLTEPDRFGGDAADIGRAKTSCRLPVLRKDFIFDPYQVAESRAIGADAILLIADMMPPAQLKQLAATAFEFGLEPLVEIFTAEAVKPALETGARLIGINTRNLRTLEMRPDNVATLSKRIPSDRYVVAESGIKTTSDVERLHAMPVFSMLVGESLLKQANREKAARGLVDAGVRPANL